jgi:hypothetical protein
VADRDRLADLPRHPGLTNTSLTRGERALIEEIEIQADDGEVPRFRIPTTTTIKGRPQSQPLINYLRTERFVYCHIVDPMWHNPNRIPAVQGPIVTLPAVRRRMP